MDVSGKRALILGLAREGASLARFLTGQGANVTVTDAASSLALAPRVRSLQDSTIRHVLDGDHPELVEATDLFFVSPGVPETNPVYTAALERGLAVQSMTTLFFDLCPGTVVGITGSSGKTTTTAMIGHILNCAGVESAIGGNIGDPMLDLLPRIHPHTVVVLELSSFQLSILTTSPHVAVITNITPNHLDRHITMDAYVGAKIHITSHQTAGDWAILNAGDSYAATFAASTRARVRWFGLEPRGRKTATIRDGWLGIVSVENFIRVVPIGDMPMPGRHNIENALAAISCADVLGIGVEDIARGIRSFMPPRHRLQTVAELGGVRYIDDSIATTPSRSIVAMQALDNPVILIAGGRDKCLPWEEFACTAVRRARAVFLIGEASEVIERALDETLHREHGLLQSSMIVRCASLERAVEQASQVAVPGDAVLLSPACASYDMFHDFEERARVFAGAVEALDAA